MSEAFSTNAILPPRGILSGVSPRSRAALTDYGEYLTYAKSETLVSQGEPANYLFFVVQGELAVTLHSPEQILPLGYIHEGETVGEMSFLEELEASASVTAASPARVWRISRERFEEFLAHHPAAGNEILKEMFILLARRARKGNERLSDAEEP